MVGRSGLTVHPERLEPMTLLKLVEPAVGKFDAILCYAQHRGKLSALLLDKFRSDSNSTMLTLKNPCNESLLELWMAN